MAMNSLEANSMLQIPILGDKNSTATEQTLSLEAENKPKKMVHQFYLVKFRPYKDPDEASKILEAEQLIVKLDQKYDQMCLQERLKFKIDQLNREKTNIVCGLETQKRMLDRLKLLLDKLNLACKIPHKHKAGPNHIHGLKSWISHGNSNLVIERKLLKEMASSPHRLNGLDLSRSSVLNQHVTFMSCGWGNMHQSRYSQINKEVRQIEERKNKALADYAENPNIFNPSTLRNAIEEKIQIVKKISLELKLDQRELEPAIERLEKQFIPMKEESLDYFGERRECWKQRKAAQRCILKLRQTFVEMNDMYDEYVSLLSNARELARNKDIAALRKLSHHQVEEFMSEWNGPVKTFRVNYESNILDSLRNRQLSNDGRIKFQNADEKTLRYIEDRSNIC